MTSNNQSTRIKENTITLIVRRLLILVLFSSVFSCATIDQSKVLNLKGTWKVKLDENNSGLAEKWFTQDPSFFEQSISLPGTLDDAGLGKKVTTEPVLERETMLHLWRKVEHIGAAWYTKEVTIPASWTGKRIELELERVIWKSQIWVDGKATNQMQNSLISPHLHDLSSLLTPGKHTITIRIDNSKQFDISLGDRNFAHAYTNETQIIWNGVIGNISLKALNLVTVSDLQVYPNAAQKNIVVKTIINNAGVLNEPISIAVDILDGNKIVGSKTIDATIEKGNLNNEMTIPITDVIKQWDEFEPNIYHVEVKISKGENVLDIKKDQFGFRNITNTNEELRINGRPLFLRGTLECNIFPKTGHPPMDKAGWAKVFSAAKSYGLNHIRFHSWCPPKAAFEVADEMGFYLQAELPVWSLIIGQNGEADSFLSEEGLRIIANYGNHPSFCFWSMGNEMQGDMNWLSNEVKKLKTLDNRRLYATTTFTFEKGYGKWPLAEDDYFVTQYTKKGWVRGQGVFDTEAPTFQKDYQKSIDSLGVPLITHEIGQYAVFPRLEEIAKYDGVLIPTNFIAVKKDLERKNMLSLAPKYVEASGKLAVLLYKEEIERALKTKGISGFQLLDLHDFPGQGTALVGVLDAFWESKGLVTPVDFRKFCSTVVPLANFEKATYGSDENFTASFAVTNYSSKQISDQRLLWKLTSEDGKSFKEGIVDAISLGIGMNNDLGKIEIPLKEIIKAQKLTLSLSLSGTTYTNDWPIWVYPKVSPSTQTSNIIITSDFDKAMEELAKGKKVLLSPQKDNLKGVEGKFVQVFWSPVHFPDQPGTMGLLLDKQHPAFSDFPTDNHTNWQWWDLCKSGKVLELDSLQLDPKSIIIRQVDNFFKNRNLASMVEVKMGNGKLLISGMDLISDIENRMVASQLRKSVVSYMNSETFAPSIEISKTMINQLKLPNSKNR